MSLTPQGIRLLSREVNDMRKNPTEGIRIDDETEEDLSRLAGWVAGPAGTPYAGGYFRVLFEFGLEYPNLPPKCTMTTKIFHPNVSKQGEICVDTLKREWKKEYGVRHVLMTVASLMIFPNPDSSLNEEAGKQQQEDFDGYCKYARLMTSIHGNYNKPPSEFAGEATPTATTLFTSAKPSPLQATDKQTQVASSSAASSQETLKTSAVKTAPAAGAAKTKAKKGLRRL